MKLPKPYCLNCGGLGCDFCEPQRPRYDVEEAQRRFDAWKAAIEADKAAKS